MVRGASIMAYSENSFEGVNMDYILYGKAVQIAKALYVTGNLWFNGGDGIIRGEDHAEVRAAQVERATIVNMVGDEAISWEVTADHTVDVVNSQHRWEAFISNTHDLLNDDITSDAWKNPLIMGYDSDYETFWIDSALDVPSGDLVLSRADLTWDSSTSGEVTLYEVGTPENGKAEILTIYDCIDYTDVWSYKHLDARIEMVDRYYGPHYDDTVSLWGSATSWWDSLELGNNMFRFPFEVKEVPEEDTLYITKTGSRFTTPRRVSMNASVPEKITVTSTSTEDSSTLNSAVFLVTSRNYNFSDTFVATDNGDSKYFDLEYKKISVAPSTQFTIGVKLKNWTWGEADVIKIPVSSFAPYGFTKPTLQTTELEFTFLNYNTYQNIEATSGYNFYNNRTYGGLIQLKFQNTHTRIAVTTEENSTGLTYTGLKFSDDCLQMIKGGSADVTISWNTVPTWTDFRHHAFPVVKDFNDVKNVYDNLNRTITFIDPSAIQCLAGTRRRYHVDEELEDSTYATYGEAELITEINKGLDAVHSSSSVAADSWDGQLLNIDIDSQVWNSRSRWDPDEDDIWTTIGEQSNLDAYGDWYITEFDSAHLDYPSDYAYSEGYVKKVHIYAIVTASACSRKGILGGWDHPYTTYTLDQSQPDFYENILKGVIPSVLELPDITLPDNSSIERHVVKEDASLFYNEIKCVKLTEVVNPTTAPTFDLGLTVIADMLLAEMQKHKEDYEKKTTTEWDETDITRVWHENIIQVRDFVVIVEWNWDHLNPDKQFTPVLNTPPYAGE